ncbi:MAG: McrC family protein [Lachnospiraceae bacterium]|nr:McrC family protein [Lachnospiraceae bacterium]
MGILYYKDEKEEYYLSLRSRFDEREGFFTEYILSKVLGACGYSFNKRLFREEDLASALKRLMEIAFLMQIDKYYCADAIRDDDLGNETNQLILLTYRRLHARDNSEWDSSWIDCMVNSHDNLKDYISRMNEYWKTSHLPDVGTFLNRNRAHTESQIRGWDKVIKTACMIQHFMNSKGANERMAGVLFDMNDLWELYLKSIFGEKNKNNSGFQLLYQWEEDILLPFGKDKGRRAIRPDFCFRTRNRYSMVLDAKNKISWAKIVEADGKDSFEKDVWRGEKSIRGDIFEVLAYMFALGCPVGGIICPVKLSAKNDYKPVSYRISHFEGAEFFVAGLPTNCPSGFRADFKEYKRIMRKREKILWEAIIGKEKT